MCGIVGAIAERDVVPILMEGLRRLEYRGYDSAGLAVLNGSKHLTRLRTVGKVRMLDEALAAHPDDTARSASRTRAGPRTACRASATPTRTSRATGSRSCTTASSRITRSCAPTSSAAATSSSPKPTPRSSRTASTCTCRRVQDLFKAVRATVAELEGAYALLVVSEHDPERLILAREGCPVVIGLGVDENFVASDVAALLPVTRRFIFLEEGDVAEVRRQAVRIIDRDGGTVERPVRESELSADAAENGPYRHFMLKEIHEQPRAIADTLQERVANGRLLRGGLRSGGYRGSSAAPAACTSSPAAPATTPPCVARYFIEQICKLPCAWTSRASTATAVRWCRPTRCS